MPNPLWRGCAWLITPGGCLGPARPPERCARRSTTTWPLHELARSNSPRKPWSRPAQLPSRSPRSNSSTAGPSATSRCRSWVGSTSSCCTRRCGGAACRRRRFDVRQTSSRADSPRRQARAARPQPGGGRRPSEDSSRQATLAHRHRGRGGARRSGGTDVEISDAALVLASTGLRMGELLSLNGPRSTWPPGSSLCVGRSPTAGRASASFAKPPNHRTGAMCPSRSQRRQRCVDRRSEPRPASASCPSQSTTSFRACLTRAPRTAQTPSVIVGPSWSFDHHVPPPTPLRGDHHARRRSGLPDCCRPSRQQRVDP